MERSKIQQHRRRNILLSLIASIIVTKKFKRKSFTHKQNFKEKYRLYRSSMMATSIYKLSRYEVD